MNEDDCDHQAFIKNLFEQNQESDECVDVMEDSALLNSSSSSSNENRRKSILPKYLRDFHL